MRVNPRLEIPTDVQTELVKLKAYTEDEFKIDSLFKICRKREYIDARRIFTYIANERFIKVVNPERRLLTLEQLMDFMGYRHHSSILHFLRDTETILRYNVPLKNKYIRLSEISYGGYQCRIALLELEKDTIQRRIVEIDNLLKVLYDEKEKAENPNQDNNS